MENVGQFDAEVKYSADLFAGRFFLTGRELVYAMRQQEGKNQVQPGKRGLGMAIKKRNASGKGLVLKEFFVDKKGAKIGFKSTGEQQAETKVSYFRGKDAGQWRAGVPSYQCVSLGEIYPGIEVKLRASGKNVEKIFHVSPGSSVAAIRIGVAGVGGMKITADGKLLLACGLGELAMRAPVAWQEIAGRRHAVKVGYCMRAGGFYGFAVKGDMDEDHPLIIDPDLDTLMASTLWGGFANEYANAMALDSAGNVYVAGFTYSLQFPTTDGAYSRDFGGATDIFVSKFDANLTELLASTFLGGYRISICNSMALDNHGDVYLTGWTESKDFPTTKGAFNREHNGQRDAVVAKLDGSLTRLLASSFLGGGKDEMGTALALGETGVVYLVGDTGSEDFPTTAGAYQEYYAGGHDAYISMMDEGLTTLKASTLLGGWMADDCSCIALSEAGHVYVSGNTDSDEIQTSPESYDRVPDGNSIYVFELDSLLTTFQASTFLHGSQGNFVTSMVLDGAGNVYLAGSTNADDFPTTPGAYDRSINGDWDLFVSKLNDGLTRLLASTFLGGLAQEQSVYLALDNYGRVVLAGKTWSMDFPASYGTYHPVFNGRQDAFVARLDGSLTSLQAATFLGGTSLDYVRSIALDNAGDIYVAGYTESLDFPTTGAAYDRKLSGVSDGYVSKLKGIGNGGVKLSLSAERRDVVAFSIVRQYGEIGFTVDTLGLPVGQYRIIRRQGNGDYVPLRTVAPSELNDNQFQMQDKYLEKMTGYTYIVEAYDEAMLVIGRSAEKRI